MQTPVSNTATSGTVTTGTINPGIIYAGNTFQVAIEAMIPVNRQSGTNVGIIGQLHFYPRRHFPEHARPSDLRNNINQGGRCSAAESCASSLHRDRSPRYATGAHSRMPCSTTPAPTVGSTVAPPPKEVVLWFTEKLEPAFSTIEVQRRARRRRCRPAKPSVDRQPHAAARPAQIAAAGDLQGDLACSVGRYPPHAGEFHLPRRALSVQRARGHAIDDRPADPGARRPFRRNAARGGHDRFHWLVAEPAARKPGCCDAAPPADCVGVARARRCGDLGRGLAGSAGIRHLGHVDC